MPLNIPIRQAERSTELEPPTAREIRYFWDRVEKIASLDRCWHWKGSISDTGYGRLSFRDSNMYAHRVAFYLRYGYWPNHCLHLYTCKRHCCNPRHLRSGTNADNILDPLSPHKYPRR